MQVAHDAVVGELEDRRLGILVDRDDRLGGLHAGPVLDGPGDARRDVQLRRDGLAGLADLELVRVPAGVGGGAGGADGRAERVGQLLDDRELLGRADAPATGDHDRRLGELRARALLLLDPLHDPGALGGVGHGEGDALLGARARGGLDGSGVGAHRDVGVPLVTRDRTLMPPPKMDWSATRPSSMPTTLVSTPESSLMARRPAISLASAVAATSTAAGELSATRWASSSALGATT